MRDTHVCWMLLACLMFFSVASNTLYAHAIHHTQIHIYRHRCTGTWDSYMRNRTLFWCSASAVLVVDVLVKILRSFFCVNFYFIFFAAAFYFFLWDEKRGKFCVFYFLFCLWVDESYWNFLGENFMIWKGFGGCLMVMGNLWGMKI